MLTHIQRLIVFSCQFLLSSKFVPHCLIYSCSASCAFDVGCIETAHIGFIIGDCVLERVFLWACENLVVLNFRVVEFIFIVLTSYFCKVVLTCRYLWGKFFRFSVEPCSIREVALFIEGTGFVVGKLVVLHNKFMKGLIIEKTKMLIITIKKWQFSESTS